MTLQEITLRGSATKLDLLFLEKYYQAGHSLPQPGQVHGFEGGFSKSFESGVFKHVLHFDVASLYPSLLLSTGKCPASDTLTIFIPLLKELREYRLRYKKLAKEVDDAALSAEYDARQASFKVIINSFYGYLGFNGARFSDSDLAAEITAKGRALLLALIQSFSENGCTVLEADTDGIYLASEEYFSHPEQLLKKVESTLPEGIELEFDGKYVSMFCYKAKNYALYDGTTLTTRGSALRSRGIEPYLKALTDCLLHYLLGIATKDPVCLSEEYRRSIEAHTMPVELLARSEYLSQNPEKYKDAVEISAKSRRASLEVALTMTPMPRMGERVDYYITPGDKARDPDWKRARCLDQFDAACAPYDSAYYTKKIDDWLKRYESFITVDTQQTLLFE
jgi:DNA polymerase elongation subunit (family B)